MLNVALKLLSKIETAGFKAYIVGGFVRDYVLGIESHDVDICTNAKPMDIRSIFHDACLPHEDYGSVTVLLKNIRFEITTFRKEYSYINNRKPVEFEFIDNLYEDLKRRDFLINTLCIDSKGNILDKLNGKKDIDNKIIHTVGNSYECFTEDAFRILRAVRFATNLKFKLSDEVKDAILKTKYLLKNISYDRKREELDKIFTSIHVKDGIKLLIELGLDKELELSNLENIEVFDDLLGVWAQLDIKEGTYRFTKNEKELIIGIRKALELDNKNYFILYKNGLYVNSIAGIIKGYDKKEIAKIYHQLPIKSKSDIKITGRDIYECLGKGPGEYLKVIFNDLEEKIIKGQLENDVDVLLEYVFNNY